MSTLSKMSEKELEDFITYKALKEFVQKKERELKELSESDIHYDRDKKILAKAKKALEQIGEES